MRFPTRARRHLATRVLSSELRAIARYMACGLGCASVVALALPARAATFVAAAPAASAANSAVVAAPPAPAAATGTIAPGNAPAAKAATGAASGENAISATPATNSSGGPSAGAGANNSATSGTAAPAPGSAGPGSSGAITSAPNPAPGSTSPSPAKAPAATSAPPAAPPPYYVSPQLRYGGYMVFRNLIPSAMLEAQAADEFNQIVYGASHANRLYADNDARVTRVRSSVDKMVPYSLKWNERAKSWKWEVAVVRSNDIRMYCLPGGKIVVYSGLLDRVRLNDNELGMLIGHEIAHALREHARMRLGQLQASQLDSSGTIPQLFGLADLGMAPLGIGSRLLEMKYESTDETEADVIGSDIASRAGFDPRAAVTLWDKLAQATRGSRDGNFIYVHPYTPARREDIIKRLPDMLPLYAKAIGKSVDALPDYAGMGRPTRKAARN
ncbi:M48 family metallopeptidase [Paraburkholderia sp. MMS20-SJTR3]|uniref:M48 family metallopeptidase n=1 Tax=Paraburkholderia sejongensis TaxID=2886946 RepID=A0ABS8JUL1_9BURK|nr:M48 family metallopeptidase [Paraburkholderia sp. MMS20-SJTR3]MCC8393414.1 M48 family metallopeptidase [Paraburkholderia sp. MMS20-SJTR3]